MKIDQTLPKQLVSVVIAYFNNSDTILSTIESVRRQTYIYWEIICVDDGSVSNIQELLNSLHDDRIHYFSLPNGNANALRNYGMLHSNGEYIAMLDANDKWLGTHLEDSLSILQEEHADGVYGSLIIKNEQSETLFISRSVAENESMIDFLLSSDCGAQTSTLLMTASSAKETSWDETLNHHQDYDFVLRYSEKFHWVPSLKPTVFYCNLSKSKDYIDYNSSIRLIEQWEKDLTPEVAVAYFEKMLAQSFSKKAEQHILEYYLSAYQKYKKIDDKWLHQTIEELLINNTNGDDLSLFHGKMGLVLFFFHYYRHTHNSLYEKIVEELLNDIYEDVHNDIPINLEFGLCGLGWGIEYLAQHQFIEGDTDEILEDIDTKIMALDVRRITDMSLETGLEGIAWYVLLRLTSPYSQRAFDEIYKKDLLYTCSKYPSKGTNALVAFLQDGACYQYPFENVLYSIVWSDKRQSWKDGLKQFVI